MKPCIKRQKTLDFLFFLFLKFCLETNVRLPWDYLGGDRLIG